MFPLCLLNGNYMSNEDAKFEFYVIKIIYIRGLQLDQCPVHNCTDTDANDDEMSSFEKPNT